jgi:hypothetical protein
MAIKRIARGQHFITNIHMQLDITERLKPISSSENHSSGQLIKKSKCIGKTIVERI